MTTQSRRTFLRILDHEYGAAVTLSLGVTIALVWSALTPTTYFRVTQGTSLAWWLRLFDASSLHQFVLEGLMTIFFYTIGLELRREFGAGDRRTLRHAVAPVSAAAGGMIATAVGSLFAGYLLHSPALHRGWGVPMATDVAFTLGILAIFGRRLPSSLRVFVLTLAVADDVLSVIVLLFTGSAHVRPTWIFLALAVCAASFLTRSRANSNATSIAYLIILWICFSRAHVEPALAGVLAGVLVSSTKSRAMRLERSAARISTGLVLPLFALVAVGVHWSMVHLSGQSGKTIMGVVAVRLVGKVAGICGMTWLIHSLGFKLSPDISKRMVAGVAILCAIGFTVPLLFAASIFSPMSTTYTSFTIGLLAASVIAAACGVVVLRGADRRTS